MQGEQIDLRKFVLSLLDVHAPAINIQQTVLSSQLTGGVSNPNTVLMSEAGHSEDATNTLLERPKHCFFRVPQSSKKIWFNARDMAYPVTK